jgi:peptidoglycan/xylan/chitin deacetylase (PgdA/CDA1 family)
MSSMPFPGGAPRETPWPAGYRSAFLITFDVDVDSGWLRRGVTDPVTLSMGRFEPKVGTPLILDLLADAGIKTTFFVPGWVAENYTPMAESLLKAGHRIGHHGYLHEPGSAFETEQHEEETIQKGLEALKRTLGVVPTGYRAPSWEFTPHTQAILERNGFSYTSDLMDTLVPDYHVIDGRRSNMLNLPVHWVLDDLAHIFYHISARKTILSTDEVLKRYVEEFDAMHAYGGLFVLTLHPRESGRPSRILMLKKFLDYVRSFNDVWIASPDEIVEYWRQTYP